ncbi:MAG: hypothetical protein J6Q32_00575 [Clostridia bacterium]|nr:hypothetical protein [Clostridia bacterium]
MKKFKIILFAILTALCFTFVGCSGGGNGGEGGSGSGEGSGGGSNPGGSSSGVPTATITEDLGYHGLKDIKDGNVVPVALDIEGFSGDAVNVWVNSVKLNEFELDNYGDFISIQADAFTIGDDKKIILETTEEVYEYTIDIATFIIDSADDLNNSDKTLLLPIANVGGAKNAAGTDSQSDWDGYFILGNDINFSGAEIKNYVNNGNGGSSTRLHGFKGIIDGRGHALKNFSTRYSLFGHSLSTAVFKNLHITDFEIIGTSGGDPGFGIFGSHAEGRLENVYIDGTMARTHLSDTDGTAGPDYQGLLGRYLKFSSMKNCTFVARTKDGSDIQKSQLALSTFCNSNIECENVLILTDMQVSNTLKNKSGVKVVPLADVPTWGAGGGLDYPLILTATKVLKGGKDITSKLVLDPQRPNCHSMPYSEIEENTLYFIYYAEGLYIVKFSIAR